MFDPKIAIFVLLSLIVGLCSCDDPPKTQDINDLINNIFNTKDDGTNPNYDRNENPNQNPNPNPNQNPNTFNPVPLTTPRNVPQPTKTTVLHPEPQEKYKSCGLDKECVPRFLCQDAIVTDGTNIIDIRFDSANDCGYLEVCCDLANKGDKPVIDPKPAIIHEGCGFRNPDGVGFRITGNNDNEAEFGEFPWMVAVLREEKAVDEILNLYECGGALIAPNAVLTAAHCVANRHVEELVVRAGEWDTQSKSEVLPNQDLDVAEIIVHERYNKGSLFNDVAILILKGGFEWQENIRPICLPPPNYIFDGSRCFATGWGKDKFGREGQYQVILKKIDMPVVPRGTCQANLRKTRLGKYFQLHDSFICAGGERGKDTCKGDGGSPLVCPVPGVKDQFYQAGIVAWGIGCGEENIPGVYANVPYLRPWIDSKLSSRGIDFQYFTT